MCQAFQSLSAEIPALSAYAEPSLLRALPRWRAKALIASLAPYYVAREEWGVLSLVGLLLAKPLGNLDRQARRAGLLIDPTEWLLWVREGLLDGLRNPLVRVTCRFYDQLRKAKTRAAEELREETVVVPPSRRDPWEIQRLVRAWASLTPKEKETAVLLYLDRLTQKEAAEELGITDRALRYRRDALQLKILRSYRPLRIL